jgi:hypothetical protein
MGEDHKDKTMGIFLVTDEIGEQTFIEAGHRESVLQMNPTGSDPVGALHRERSESTGRKGQLLTMEAPLSDRIATELWRHIAEHLLGCVKIRALRQF